MDNEYSFIVASYLVFAIFLLVIAIHSNVKLTGVEKKLKSYEKNTDASQ